MTETKPTLIRVIPADAPPPADLFDGDVVERAGRGLWRVSVDPMTGVLDFTRMTPRDCGSITRATIVGCATCRAGTPVSHLGYSACRSGSLRSGGSSAHCTCDGCF